MNVANSPDFTNEFEDSRPSEEWLGSGDVVENPFVAPEENFFKSLHLSIARNLKPDQKINDKTKYLDDHIYTDQDLSAFSSIFEESEFQCQFCGLISHKFLTVHHLDNNHYNNRKSNLAAACPFCHAVFHLGLAGKNQGGMIIFAPEIPQFALNRIVRSLFIAQKLRLPEFEKLIPEVWKALANRCEPVKKTWGSADPIKFASAFSQIGEETFETSKERLGSLRLLISPKCPLIPRDSIDYWADKAQSKRAEFQALNDFLSKIPLRNKASG